jgi:HK97 family phage major capsid protein
MLDQIRAALRAKLDERQTKQEELDALLAAPAAEARDLTDDEAAKFADLKSALAAADGEIDQLRDRVKDLEDLEARKAERDQLARDLQPGETPETRTPARVTREEPVYNERSEHSFFADALAWRTGAGGLGVAERLQRHENEVRAGVHGEARDVGTGAFGNGLVIPQYLPEKYAEVLRAGRVTANLCSAEPLPDEGMTITIPRGTTGTAVASQSDENTGVQETDFDETDLTFNVRTLAGQQDVSRQAIERGRGTDAIIYRDLASAYAVTLDSQVINGDGTNGTHLGILRTGSIGSVTTGTATAASVLAKIAQAIATVNGARFMPPDVIVMHPRRWGWLTAQADSNGRPYVLPESGRPQNAFGVGDPAAYGFVGTLHGLPVYTDANIPTTISTSTVTGATEDNIIVARRSDLLLFEDSPAPRQFRFEETAGGSLTVKLVVAGYSAFTAGWYPAGVAVISGSGMTTPVYPS